MLSRQSTKPNISAQYQTQVDWEVHAAVDLWEQGTTDTISFQNDAGESVYAQGTCPGGPNIGKPVFQFLNMKKSFSEGGTMVAESENAVSFIPAGFRNAPTQNTMNPVREEIGGSSALMSLVHVLTIPKDIRIYNACTLRKNHIPLLEEMKELGEKAVVILRSGPKEMIGSLQWVLNQRGTIEMNDGSSKSLEVEIDDFSQKTRGNVVQLDGGISVSPAATVKIKNAFHVFPCASIGWLHLHSYLGDLITTAHDSMEAEALAKYNQPKNTPYEEILAIL
jgi:hypothetical protein